MKKYWIVVISVLIVTIIVAVCSTLFYLKINEKPYKLRNKFIWNNVYVEINYNEDEQVIYTTYKNLNGFSVKIGGGNIKDDQSLNVQEYKNGRWEFVPQNVHSYGDGLEYAIILNLQGNEEKVFKESIYKRYDNLTSRYYRYYSQNQLYQYPTFLEFDIIKKAEHTRIDNVINKQVNEFGIYSEIVNANSNEIEILVKNEDSISEGINVFEAADGFYIDKLENEDTWVRLNPEKEFYSDRTHMKETQKLLKGETTRFKINLAEYYKNLTPGIYRIVSTQSATFWSGLEFEIK